MLSSLICAHYSAAAQEWVASGARKSVNEWGLVVGPAAPINCTQTDLGDRSVIRYDGEAANERRRKLKKMRLEKEEGGGDFLPQT